MSGMGLYDMNFKTINFEDLAELNFKLFLWDGGSLARAISQLKCRDGRNKIRDGRWFSSIPITTFPFNISYTLRSR